MSDWRDTRTAGDLPAGRGDGRMAYQVHRLVAPDEIVVSVKRPTLCLALYSSLVRADQLMDPGSWQLFVPPRRRRFEAFSPSVTLLTLAPSHELIASTKNSYRGIESAKLKRAFSTPQSLVRSTWVDELCQRYAFERAICRADDGRAAAFLEEEIIKEWYFAFVAAEEGGQRPADELALVDKAIGYIDRNFHQSISIPKMASAIGVSESVLLRAMRQRFGISTSAYVRARRLDEASMLLRAGSLSVQEIARRVGYSNLSAFSQAFRERFGVSPSAFRTAGRS